MSTSYTDHIIPTYHEEQLETDTIDHLLLMRFAYSKN